MAQFWNTLNDILARLGDDDEEENASTATAADSPVVPQGPLTQSGPGVASGALAQYAAAADRAGDSIPHSTDIEEIPINGVTSTEPPPEVLRRMQAIWGETSSLRPQLINPSGSADRADNWSPDSLAKLQQARATIGAMNGTANPDMYYAQLPTNPTATEQQQLDLIRQAAETSMTMPRDPSLSNMSMHQQGGKGRQIEQEWLDNGGSLVGSQGPFIQTWDPPQSTVIQGRAIPAGPNAYIDFYNLPNQRRRSRWSGGF